MAAPRAPAFRGRANEREVIDRLLKLVRRGESAVLVVRGEAGIGKTALLRYIAEQGVGFRVTQIAGVESEMELPFAGVHQLCSPMLTEQVALPKPQEYAMRVAFGLESGDPPDLFVVGLAVLSLLSEVSAKQPLLCLVDDSQWLDGASSQALGFVARRLLAESVLLVFAVREPTDGDLLLALPEMRLEGLLEEDAREMLSAVIHGHVDETVRDRIVAETRGNPLALLELSRELSAAELGGGFAGPPIDTLHGRIEELYLRRFRALPDETQLLMVIAAADPTGDATILWRAAQTLGIPPGAGAADAEELLSIGARVRFRHPLVRSAIYAAASVSERRMAHLALAAATDADADPDRRVWHLAAAATGPDEAVAAELERSAGRALARGGLPAAAAFLQRSAALTSDEERRTERALAAAYANLNAGRFRAGLDVLVEAEVAAVNDLQRARVDLLRGQIASASNAGSEAPGQLLKAARRLEQLDRRISRETYLDAWGAALFAGRLAQPGGRLADVSIAARSAPPPPDGHEVSDFLLEGLATLVTEGRDAAAATLRRAVDAFRDDSVSAEQWLHWGILASSAAAALWDFETWAAFSGRQVELARTAGALAPLSVALTGHGMIATWSGDFETAISLGAEDDFLKQLTGTHIAPYGTMLLVGYQGRPEEALALISATSLDAAARGEGLGVQLASWAKAILHNGLGQYEEALDAAEQARDEDAGPFITAWVLPELIEAANRAGRPQIAADALERLAESIIADEPDWAAGIYARSRALVVAGDLAERCYVEAIERLSRTPLRPEIGRAHLLYGEWLRREDRRTDARHELRLAYDLFATLGAEGFAERTRRELLATGETVRKRNVDADHELTPQEEYIARLAREGRTNSEIGSELFISARTVEWHLRKVFTKLGITSRKDLHNVLPDRVAQGAR